ncbi:hypothetical protein F5X68DRAFT_202091 [Plectosphaerella plurivora]|uniref:Uncharacterized protein n=1 Tax=Plectosphaerella plurivora TaxID=936078 RepID=A0A9P8VFI8_9PEZI|nr:hypothetical protein F5X68DRAFT_202091 [Plectosphaerella plurivora]
MQTCVSRLLLLAHGLGERVPVITFVLGAKNAFGDHVLHQLMLGVSGGHEKRVESVLVGNLEQMGVVLDQLS